ncbi:hypothetical protein C3L33_17761, partial [Rhododendron williamsianum]
VKKLEAQGVPSKHAEAITAAITEVLNDNLVNVTHSFVSKAETQKIEMIQESNLSKFKAKVQSYRYLKSNVGLLKTLVNKNLAFTSMRLTYC